MRTISLNWSYLVVFNNLRDKVTGYTIIPGEIKYFKEIRQDVFSKEHGFLIIDLLPTTLNEFRLRTFDFKNKIVYVYIKN